MALRSPNDLIVKELKEIYSAERQLSRVIPKFAKSVSSEKLREMLDRRREQGTELIEALDEAFDDMGTSKGRPKNPAIEGLIEDINQDASDIDDDRVLDVALLAGVQKIEHYCIAAWGTSASLGRALQLQKVVDAMQHALEQGKQFDQEMTQLAENEVNPAMLEQSEEGEGGETEEGGSQKRQGGRGRRKSAA
jgi:ferritin-like metal-binding protein YciE